MKKTLFTIALVTGLLAITAASLLYIYLPSYWQLVSSEASPNKRYQLHLYNNQSDHDRHAPYGQYLFLNSSKSLKKPYDGDVIFAGYCRDNLQYRWQDNQQILIHCAADVPNSAKNTRTLTVKIMNIDIIMIDEPLTH